MRFLNTLTELIEDIFIGFFRLLAKLNQKNQSKVGEYRRIEKSNYKFEVT
jgi:hypothetical protein